MSSIGTNQLEMHEKCKEADRKIAVKRAGQRVAVLCKVAWRKTQERFFPAADAQVQATGPMSALHEGLLSLCQVDLNQARSANSSRSIRSPILYFRQIGRFRGQFKRGVSLSVCFS